jgi:hypothetical protein
MKPWALAAQSEFRSKRRNGILYAILDDVTPESAVARAQVLHRRIGFLPLCFRLGYVRRVTIALRLVRSNPKRVGSSYGRFHAHRRGQQ